jgi:hypothetical protein
VRFQAQQPHTFAPGEPMSDEPIYRLTCFCAAVNMLFLLPQGFYSQGWRLEMIAFPYLNEWH